MTRTLGVAHMCPIPGTNPTGADGDLLDLSFSGVIA